MLNTQDTIFESLIDKFKVGYALRLLAQSNEFLYKIKSIDALDKYIRLYYRDKVTGNKLYYFNPGDSQIYSITDNSNAFLQTESNELYIYTLGIVNGMGIEVYNPPTTPLLGTQNEPDAIITYEKSPIDNPNPLYRFKSFRTHSIIVAPKIVATNKINSIVVNPYLRIYGIVLELAKIEKLPETYTTIPLYSRQLTGVSV